MRKRIWQQAKLKAPPRPKLSGDEQSALMQRATATLENLKTRFCKTPKQPQFNWCHDIFLRWHRDALYFVALFRTPHGQPPEFEVHVARLEHAGDRKFNFAVPIRRGWNTIERGFSIEDALKEVENGVVI